MKIPVVPIPTKLAEEFERDVLEPICLLYMPVIYMDMEGWSKDTVLVFEKHPRGFLLTEEYIEGDLVYELDE